MPVTLHFRRLMDEQIRAVRDEYGCGRARAMEILLVDAQCRLREAETLALTWRDTEGLSGCADDLGHAVVPGWKCADEEDHAARHGWDE